MRFLVVGAGATGGYFGGRLAASGADVTFLVRPSRAEVLKANGLSIESSSKGDLVIAAQIATRADLAKSFDCVLLAVKAYHLSDVLNDLAPAIGQETMILPLLNGLRHLELLAERFGHRAVLGGTCHIGVTLESNGRIRHLGIDDSLRFGELDGVVSERTRELAEALSPSGVQADISAKIIADMWEKWVGLAALAALTCLLRGSVGQLSATRWGHSLAEQIIQEVASIANANGYTMEAEFLARLKAQLTLRASPQTCSLYRDLTNGSPVESEHVLVDLWERGMRAGICGQLLAATAAQLAIHNARCHSTPL